MSDITAGTKEGKGKDFAAAIADAIGKIQSADFNRPYQIKVARAKDAVKVELVPEEA